MHIVVVGAGVVGVTTAYFLARDGHAVTVLDGAPAPALGCSHANGGLVTGFAASPWSAPGIPTTVLREFWRSDAPYRVHLRPDPAMAVWIARFFGNCTRARTHTIKANLRRLARYSYERMMTVVGEHEIAYDRRRDGLVYLYDREAALDAAESVAQQATEPRARPVRLSPEALLDLEPALGESQAIYAGALHYAHDETGDARKFALGVAAAAKAAGASFRFSTTVTALTVAQGRVRGVRSDHGDVDADAVVVAAGTGASALVAPFGVRLPMYPVKGYSVTVTAADPGTLPRHALQDAARKITLTPLGDRIRAAGTAELAGHDTRLDPRRAESLLAQLQRLLPDLAWHDAPVYWTGLRPMTSDSLPVLGATHVDGLWLNTGHGSFGFTMACGAAAVLSDLVAKRPPEIDLSGLGLR